jgi:SAM-dependent methyltransferase
MIAKIGIQIIGYMKRNLREQRSSKSPIIRLGAVTLYFLRDAVISLKRFCVDKEYRSLIFLQVLNSKNVHQTTPFTYMNRYPEIFSACQDYLKGKQNLSILSYGCSTGEEVLTLRNYFPTAKIIGAEINKRSLKICRTLPVDDNTVFIHSKPDDINKHGAYNAVFCMAVLQRKPHYIAEKGISSLKKIYPFEKFEQQILELDELIKPGGLLIIHYTQYSLSDTAIASKYKALGSNNQGISSPLFDKNSNLVKSPISQNSIYIKVQQ